MVSRLLVDSLASTESALAVACLALLVTSEVPIRLVRWYVDVESTEWPNDIQRRMGTVIGKCENVLVFVFVLADAFTALAVIFAAEGIVSRELDERDSYYVLAGTLVNFTYSILFSLVITSVLS